MPDSTNFSERFLGPDTHANRPAATDVPEGALYSCTDHTALYVSRSGSWVDWLTAVSAGAAETQVITFRSASTQAQNAGTSVVVTKPSGVVDGDVMIASLAHYGDCGTITPPSGWTLIRTTTQTTHPAEEVNTYYKIASSEGANYTWSWVNSLALVAGISAWINVDVGDPIDQDNGQGQTSTVTVTAPAITPSTGYTKLIFVGGIRSGRTFTAPAGMTERLDAATTLGTSSDSTLTHAGVDYGGDGSTSTGTKAATASGSSTNSSNCGQLINLNAVVS